MINKDALTQVIGDIVLEKTCSIKPDKDSNDAKQVNLSVSFEGATMREVFASALSSAVIKWQNGPGRKKFATWTAGQTIEIDFRAPGKTVKTPEEIRQEALESFATMSAEDQKKYMADLQTKMNGNE